MGECTLMPLLSCRPEKRGQVADTPIPFTKSASIRSESDNVLCYHHEGEGNDCSRASLCSMVRTHGKRRLGKVLGSKNHYYHNFQSITIQVIVHSLVRVEENQGQRTILRRSRMNSLVPHESS